MSLSVPVNNSERMDVGQSEQQVLHVKLHLDKVHRLDDLGKLGGLDVRHREDDVAQTAANEQKGQNVGLATGHSQTVHLH